MKKTIVVSILAIALIIIMILLCGSGTPLTSKAYTLKEGDTLWELYTEYGNSIQWGKWLYEMEKANVGNDLYCAGENIILLTSEGSGFNE